MVDIYKAFVAAHNHFLNYKMVKSASIQDGSQTNKVDGKNVIVIENRSIKPPGSSRFQRRKDHDEKVDVYSKEVFVADIATVCQKLLVDGYVQSYVDFYHLTHRVDPLAHESILNKQIYTSPEDMIFIRNNLVQAELSRRQGDTPNVYGAFSRLADYYVEKKDWKTGIFFHDKCLEVSQLTSDVRAEMTANNSLGIIHQAMADFVSARKYHERHEELALSVDLSEDVSLANLELYKVYLVLATKFEENGAIDDAVDMYHRCLEAAKKSWDKAAECEANGRIGTIYLNKGQAQASLPYLQQQSHLASELGQPQARCKACSALALALDSLGQTERALSELTLVRSISEQSGDALLQAQSCRALGTLYSKIGRLEMAVDMLQKHFSLLKGILYKATAGGGTGAAANENPIAVTSRDLDLARTFIGIAKGNLVMGSYIISLQFDLSSMLDWKLNRTDLPSGESSIPTNIMTYASSIDAAVLNRPITTATNAVVSQSSANIASNIDAIRD